MKQVIRVAAVGVALALAVATVPAAAAQAGATPSAVTAPPSAVAAGVAAPGAMVDALAATAPAADLDDFRSNRRYAKYFGQRIRWSAKTCPKGGFFNGIMECARIKVPKDWYHLSAGDIYVGLSRLGGDAKQPRRSRLLLTNPGGPGADGLEFGVISALFLGVNKTHTTIGIDPRGVGLSTQLRCSNERLAAGSYRADGDSRSYTPEQVAADAKGRAAYVSACARTTKSFLPYVNSDQTARDFNLVRHLMGYKTLDYYGVSYGTWLGSLLEKMFPNKVARVVLDANTDWAGGSVDKVFSYQPMAFQAQFDRVFLPWLGRHDAAYHLGGSAQAVNDTYERIREAARAGRFGRIGTPDILDAYLVQAQYSTFAWDDAGVMMGKMLAAMDGDAAALTDVQDVFTETAKDDVDVRSVYIAVRCNDTAAERSTSRWFAATRAPGEGLPVDGSHRAGQPVCLLALPPRAQPRRAGPAGARGADAADRGRPGHRLPGCAEHPDEGQGSAAHGDRGRCARARFGAAGLRVRRQGRGVLSQQGRLPQGQRLLCLDADPVRGGQRHPGVRVLQPGLDVPAAAGALRLPPARPA